MDATIGCPPQIVSTQNTNQLLLLHLHLLHFENRSTSTDTSILEELFTCCAKPKFWAQLDFSHRVNVHVFDEKKRKSHSSIFNVFLFCSPKNLFSQVEPKNQPFLSLLTSVPDLVKFSFFLSSYEINAMASSTSPFWCWVTHGALKLMLKENNSVR